MTHFTDSELQRWREAGPGDDRTRVAAHLQECAACASRYAGAIRTRPLAAADAAGDAHEFVAAGYAVARGSSVVPFPARRWVVALAAAAALVAAVAISRMLHREPAVAELRFRGAGIHALEPEGGVDRVAEFVWSSGLSASRYKLEIGRGGSVIYTSETSASRLRTPDALAQMLTPGVEYWWTVTALDADGRPLTSSDRQTFNVRSR